MNSSRRSISRIETLLTRLEELLGELGASDRQVVRFEDLVALGIVDRRIVESYLARRRTGQRS